MWTTKQMNNPPLKQRQFGCKIYELLLESPREFELIQRNFIFRFPIGSKGARDDGSRFLRRLVTSQLKHQTCRVIRSVIEFCEPKKW